MFRGLGINIVYLGDFHDDSDISRSRPQALPEQKVYFEGARKLSDKNFLVMPEEEVNVYLRRPLVPDDAQAGVLFARRRRGPTEQPFEENDPTYGTSITSARSTDVMKMVNREQGIMWVAHPRTKSSAMYPDIYKDKDFFLSDRFIGGSWESLPVDQSQEAAVRGALLRRERRDEQLGAQAEVHAGRGRHVHEGARATTPIRSSRSIT